VRLGAPGGFLGGRSGPEGGSGPVCIHSVLESPPRSGRRGRGPGQLLKGPLHLQDGRWSRSPRLGIPLDPFRCGRAQMPVAGGFVTRVFGLLDDPKRPGRSGATFMNLPWRDWLERAGSGGGDLAGEPGTSGCPAVPADRDREESLRLALPLQDRPTRRTDGSRHARRSALAGRKLPSGGRGGPAGRRPPVEDTVAARRFIEAVASSSRLRPPERRCISPGPAPTAARTGPRSCWPRPTPWSGCGGIAPGRGHGSRRVGRPGLRPAVETISTAILGSRGRREPGIGSGLRSPKPADPSEPWPPRAWISAGAGPTPSHSLEKGGTVLNAGDAAREYPILAEGIRLEERG